MEGFEKAQEAIRRAAEAEARYDGGGFLFTPYDFIGGAVPRNYSFQCEPRLATWIYGARTRFSTLSATFRLPGRSAITC